MLRFLVSINFDDSDEREQLDDFTRMIKLKYSDIANCNMEYIDLDKNEKEYIKNSKENRKDDVVLTVEVLTLLAWKYAESQQKPKERGSADINLKDIGDELVAQNFQDDDIRYGRIVPIEGKDKASEEFEIQEITNKIKKKLTDKLGKKFIETKIEKAKNEMEIEKKMKAEDDENNNNNDRK